MFANPFNDEELGNRLASIRGKMAERDLEIDKAYKELEAEIEELEKDGAKDKDLKARQRDAERDIAALREEYEEEVELVQRIFDEFKDLHSRKIIEDEMLWRELADRYGDYFEGGMGADVIAQLIDRIDLDHLEELIIDTWLDRAPRRVVKAWLAEHRPDE